MADDKNIIIDVLVEGAKDLQLISTSLNGIAICGCCFPYPFSKIVQTVSNVIAIVIVHSENE